jgi:diguanylate cyclase (GGDEF)-like protein/PAS domain S-box-containing protein
MSLILILDDRGTNRKILGRLAQSVEPDAEVVAFADPVETLEWLKANEPDLIITDYRMPHLDGAEVTSHIRRTRSGADVPIVVVTAYDDPVLRVRALEAGATDFLLSPVDHVEFRSRVRNLLALRRHQKRLRDEAEGLARDLAASERSRDAVIRESRQALAQLIDTVPALISAADAQGRLVFVNARQASEAGRTPGELVGHDVEHLLGEARATRSRAADAEVFATGRALPGFEEEVPDGSGGGRTLLTAKAPLRDAEGRVVAVLSTSMDISDRKRAEQRLLFLARHDPLTGLPNRTLLSEMLENRCRAPGQPPFALLFLDLDGFKTVNDVLGHQAGDRLLRDVASRLAETAESEAAICRLGGDEFAVLQHAARTPQDAAGLAMRLLDALEQPFNILGRSTSVSASIGVTLYPGDGTAAEELLRNADLAMYRAKGSGRKQYRLFDRAMDEAARDAMRLASDLRDALVRGEFELHWQPQVSLDTGRITGAEALLRWHHPERGLLHPNQFLTPAEESGLIARITEWVLGAACRQGAAWARTGEGIRVGVNLSPSLFRSADIPSMVAAALDDSGLPPALLDIELTEREQLGDVAEAARILHQLRALGVGLSLDDFGIGYSSLVHAGRLPVQRIKIDQSFIADFLADPTAAAIVGAVMSLGRRLGMGIVAEGVETREQLEALRELGCDEVQGYFLSPPVPTPRMSQALAGPVPWQVTA